MAHEIETMMYAGETPWHGLGVRVPQEVTSEEAIRHAGLDWRVHTAPVLVNAPGLVLAGAALPPPQEVPGFRAVVRSSDGAPLGVVGDRYRPIQNENAFAFFDSVVGEGQAIYHTAGSLNGGRKVWILAKLPGYIRVPNTDDVTERYLLLSNSHDGSQALRMHFSPVRVVCANTLNAALRRGEGEGITIRHTASAPVKVEEARRALGIALRYYDELEAMVQRLAAARFTDAQMKDLAEEILPIPEGKGEPTTRTERAREKVIELFTYGRGHEPIRGTAWAAFNAVSEYTDHHRGTRRVGGTSEAEARLASSWFGTGRAMKQRALEAISRQLAA